jgi:hypothetical protein
MSRLSIGDLRASVIRQYYLSTHVERLHTRGTQDKQSRLGFFVSMAVRLIIRGRQLSHLPDGIRFLLNRTEQGERMPPSLHKPYARCSFTRSHGFYSTTDMLLRGKSITTPTPAKGGEERTGLSR